jgi:hypothetical protein
MLNATIDRRAFRDLNYRSCIATYHFYLQLLKGKSPANTPAFVPKE